MSATFIAGQKLRAIDMVPQKIWTVSATTNSSSVTTSETVVYSSPSTDYRAGRAWLLSLRGRFVASAGALDATIAIRDTNVSGTFRMGATVYRVPATVLTYGFHHEHIVVNTGGDITARVLALSVFTSVNSVVINGSASSPFYWSCMEIGDATDFPEGVAL